MSAPDDTTPRRELPTRAEVLATLDHYGETLGIRSAWSMHLDSGKVVSALIDSRDMSIFGVGSLSDFAATNIRWQCVDYDGAPMPWSKLAAFVVEAQRGGQEVAPC